MLRPMRATDPVAERLLGVVLRLENAPWPGALRAYGASLLALASRCEQPAAQAEIYRWFLREAGGALVVFDDARRARLQDAFHDMVVAIPGVLLRFRAGLDPGRRPNLQSMLVKWIEWRAGDLHRSEARHASRRAPYRADDRLASGAPDLALQLVEVLALLRGADPIKRALRLVGLGYSIASAARLTGVSRQKIYRARRALRATLDGLDDGAE